MAMKIANFSLITLIHRIIRIQGAPEGMRISAGAVAGVAPDPKKNAGYNERYYIRAILQYYILNTTVDHRRNNDFFRYQLLQVLIIIDSITVLYIS